MAMRSVLVLNCGSSSVKFDWFELPAGENPLRGRVERVGSPEAFLVVETDGAGKVEVRVEAKDAAAAVALALDTAVRARGVPQAIGHRVVHGGERFVQATEIDDDVVRELEAVSPLAPLHNPVNLAGIRAARSLFPHVPNVAVFDTAFHATLPEEAFLYAIPRALHREKGYRRYGFHGTSHAYVARKTAEFLGKSLDSLRIVTLHLGNGCSAAAVAHGRSVDTSMGLTPLDGLVMGTRAGDVDPALVLRLARELGVDKAESLLNRQSGLLGLSELSNDLRDLETAARDGHAGATLAIRTMARRLTKYVGAYAAVMGGIDALVFTGGIGENSGVVRALVTERLEFLGIRVSVGLNDAAGRGVRRISEGPVDVLVVPTDEEFEIARETVEALDGAD